MGDNCEPPAKRLKIGEEPFTPDPSSPADSCQGHVDSKEIELSDKMSEINGGKVETTEQSIMLHEADSATKQTVEVVIPTPPATQEQQPRLPISPAMTATTTGDNLSNVITVSSDLSASATTPPPKKRKPRTPKERTTERLNLSKLDYQPKLRKKQLASLLKIFRTKKKIVVIAGAGISVAAGIPDFRSSTGLFTTLRSDYKLKGSGKHLFDAAVYKDDNSTSSFHDMVRKLHGLSKDATPTLFHELLQTLAKEKRLLRLYTQNVDCIDTQMEGLSTQQKLASKAPWPTTIQLHGGINHMVCQKCGEVTLLRPEIFEGSTPPDCRDCLGLEEARKIGGRRSLGIGKLRPRMVLYNEENPDAEAIGAVTEADLRARPDALIVVGTSLKIPGVKRIVREMCGVVRDLRGGMTVWINKDEPPVAKEFDGVFDLVVKGDCQQAARLIKQGDAPLTPVSMSDTDSELSVLSMASDEEMEQMIRSSLPKPAVVIPRPQKSTSTSPQSKKDGVKTASKGLKRFSDGTVKKPTKKISPATKAVAASSSPVKKAKAPSAKSVTQSSVKVASPAKKIAGPSTGKAAKTVGAKATASRIPVAKTTKTKVVPSKIKVSKLKLQQKSKITGQFKNSKAAVLVPSKATKKQQQQQQQQEGKPSDHAKSDAKNEFVIPIVKDMPSSIADAENTPMVISTIPPPPSRSPSPPPPPPPSLPHTPTDLTKMSLANILT